MCKRVLMGVLAIVLAALLCSTIAWAQDQGQGGPPPGMQGGGGYGGGGNGPGPGMPGGGHQGPGGFGRPGGPGGSMMMSPAMVIAPPSASMVRRLTQTLQLTESQVEKLQDITASSDKSRSALTQKVSDASRDLRSAVLAANYDAKKVGELASKAEKAEAEVINASLATWNRIRNVLTDDQIAKLPSAMGPQGFGRGPGGPRPGGENGADRMGPPPTEGNQPPPPPPFGQ